MKRTTGEDIADAAGVYRRRDVLGIGVWMVLAMLTPFASAQTTRVTDPLQGITDKDIEAIDYDDAVEDRGFVGPLRGDLDHLDDESRKRLTEWAVKLAQWEGAKEKSTAQKVRNLMAVCGLSDLAHAEFEGEIGYVVFEKLKSEIDRDVLIKCCAWVVLKPTSGKCPNKIVELGWDQEIDADLVRERAALYAKKLLGRLVGKLGKK